ncbi:MAG: GntR family transcriptional regulator [Kineosporiaceae bacterium]
MPHQPDTPLHPPLYTTADAESSPAPGPTSRPARAGRDRRANNASRREQVYGELRRRILVAEFPARTRLAEERLAALLEVSRTPVREALVRLHADRLLRRHPDGGYEVAEPDLADLRDLYELRVTLEVRGLTRALEGRKHDLSQLEPLRDHWRRLRADTPDPDSRFVEEDEAFHTTLNRASGNLALTETLTGVNARIRPVRMYDFLTSDRIEETISQHLEIVEAVLAEDIPEALQALRRHVGVSLEVVERRAEHAITQMALMRGRRS